MMFDIETALKNSTFSRQEFEVIKKYCRIEFPNDDMMYELHVVRAILAHKRKGHTDGETARY